MSEATQNDYEMIEWFDITNLPQNSLSNLIWLVPMAKQIIEGKKFDVKIVYS